jgi:hypothetical protein
MGLHISKTTQGAVLKVEWVKRPSFVVHGAKSMITIVEKGK